MDYTISSADDLFTTNMSFKKVLLYDNEQALLRTVLQAILVQLTNQTTQPLVSLLARDVELHTREITGEP